jgi:hypothetical protein
MQSKLQWCGMLCFMVESLEYMIHWEFALSM